MRKMLFRGQSCWLVYDLSEEALGGRLENSYIPGQKAVESFPGGAKILFTFTCYEFKLSLSKHSCLQGTPRREQDSPEII